MAEYFDINNNAAVLLILLVTTVGASAFAFQSSAPHSTDTNINQDAGYQGHVDATLYNADGEVIDTHQGENLLTNDGANYFRSLATGQTSNAIDWVALSTEANYQKDVTNDFLASEVTQNNLSRTQAEISTTDTGEWEINAEWTASGEVNGVTAAGLFPHDVQGTTDDPSNILVAEETMNEKVFRDGYTFELTWTIRQVPG